MNKYWHLTIFLAAVYFVGCLGPGADSSAKAKPDPAVAEELREIEAQKHLITATLEAEKAAAAVAQPANPAEADDAGMTEEEKALYEKQIMPDDTLEVEAWFADGKSQLPGFPYKKKVPKSGKVFMPFAGVINVERKTDEEVEAFMGAYFASVVQLNTQRQEAIKKRELEAMAADAKPVPQVAAEGTAGIILPGDLITIEVWLHDRATQLNSFPFSRQVPEDGKIFIPHIGMHAVGEKSMEALSQELTKIFSGIVQNPVVVIQRQLRELPNRVYTEAEQARRRAAFGKPREELDDKDRVPQEIRGILEAPIVLCRHDRDVATEPRWRAMTTNRRFVILGRVTQPGLYPLEGSLDLREAIAVAGGMARYAADTRILIVRGNEVLTINFDDIIKGRNLTQNIQIQPRDAIYVPPSKMWLTADAIQTVLLPVTAMRDAIFVYDRWRED